MTLVDEMGKIPGMHGWQRPLDAAHGLWPWALAQGRPERGEAESKDDEVGATGPARGDPRWISLGMVLIACWWQIARLGDVRIHLKIFYGWFAMAFGGYLAMLWMIRHTERANRSPMAAFLMICVVAVLARLLMLPTTPTVSDDLYRYRWDGRVQQAGIDPYAYPPNDPALAALRDESFSHINFPHLRTVYPPLAQLMFRVGIALGPTLTAQKIVGVGAELLLMAALVAVLRARGRSPLWLAAYAWHPLPILEVAGSGHNDVLAIAMLWIGLAAWSSRQWLGVTVGWALSFLAKFGSLVLVPWWSWHGARRWLLVFGLFTIGVVALRPTMVSAVIDSMSAMQQHRAESNSSLYSLLLIVSGSATLARVVCYGLLGAIMVWAAARELDPAQYLLIVFGAGALLSPVLHPWYLLWLIPCFCLWQVPSLVALSGTVVLSYTVWPGYLAHQPWVVPLWARLLEYAPVICLMPLTASRRWMWRSSRPLAVPPSAGLQKEGTYSDVGR